MTAPVQLQNEAQIPEIDPSSTIATQRYNDEKQKLADQREIVKHIAKVTSLTRAQEMKTAQLRKN